MIKRVVLTAVIVVAFTALAGQGLAVSATALLKDGSTVKVDCQCASTAFPLQP